MNLVAVALFAASLHAGNVNDLVDRVIAAYGGAAAWSRVEAFRETGTVTPAMGSATGTMTREWQRPDKLRVEIVYPTRTEVRVVIGDKGTQNGKEAAGMGLDAMRLQAARLALPLLLAEKRSSLRDLGMREGLHEVEIPLGGPMSMTVAVDPKSGRIVRTTGRSSGIEFATSYGDYRTVEGLLFAFHEENSADGMKTAANDLSRVEINPAK